MFECSLSSEHGFTTLRMRGRIDGMSSPEIDRALSELILEGERAIVANLKEASYISSAGIRVFLAAQKRLKKAGGEIILCEVPPLIFDVFDLGGLTSLFQFLSADELHNPDGTADSAPNPPVSRTIAGLAAEIIERPAGPGSLRIIGSQTGFRDSSYTREDVVDVPAGEIRFGAGLAAFGDRFEDYRDYFGESVIMDHSLYFYPAVKRPAVDFMLYGGNEAEYSYRFLHGFGFTGEYRYLVSLESPEGFLDLADAVRTFFEISSANLIGIVFLAESKGIRGMHVRKVPLAENRPSNGLAITDPENFREWMSFPVEPGDFNNVIAGSGIAVRDRERATPEVQALFSRDSAIHLHAGVFQQEPLNRNIAGFEEELRRVLTDLEVYRVQHLLGQSSFSRCMAGIIELGG